jgi:hypothetical protein
MHIILPGCHPAMAFGERSTRTMLPAAALGSRMVVLIAF